MKKYNRTLSYGGIFAIGYAVAIGIGIKRNTCMAFGGTAQCTPEIIMSEIKWGIIWVIIFALIGFFLDKKRNR